MKTTTKKFLINPEVLDLITNHIKQNYRNTPSTQERWSFRYIYIFSTIYKRQQYSSNGGTLNFNSTRELLSLQVSQMSDILRFFLDTGIIVITSKYVPKVKSYSYIIHPNFSQNIIIHKLSTPKDFMENNNTLSTSSAFYTTYFNNLKNIKVNLPLKYFISNQSEMGDYIEPLQQILIEEMNEGNIYFTQPNSDSRLYHPICNLNRNMRKHINWNNRGVIQSDIVASQIYLATIQYIKASNTPISELPQDVVDLIEVCKSGKFYEVMMSQTNHKDRNKYKQSFFKDVFFCKETSMERSKIGKAFKELFPTMFNFIYEFKETCGYKEYSTALQKFEWQLIRKVLERLYEQGFEVINLHDAILYPEDVDSDTIEGIINEVYLEQVGITPVIKSEQISFI